MTYLALDAFSERLAIPLMIRRLDSGKAGPVPVHPDQPIAPARQLYTPPSTLYSLLYLDTLDPAVRRARSSTSGIATVL
jgi:hypothetical protein